MIFKKKAFDSIASIIYIIKYWMRYAQDFQLHHMPETVLYTQFYSFNHSVLIQEMGNSFSPTPFLKRTVLEKMSCPFPVLTLRGYNEVENYIDTAGKSET